VSARATTEKLLTAYKAEIGIQWTQQQERKSLPMEFVSLSLCLCDAFRDELSKILCRCKKMSNVPSLRLF
jgi:hypothetical protein